MLHNRANTTPAPAAVSPNASTEGADGRAWGRTCSPSLCGTGNEFVTVMLFAPDETPRSVPITRSCPSFRRM